MQNSWKKISLLIRLDWLRCTLVMGYKLIKRMGQRVVEFGLELLVLDADLVDIFLDGLNGF